MHRPFFKLRTYNLNATSDNRTYVLKRALSHTPKAINNFIHNKEGYAFYGAPQYAQTGGSYIIIYYSSSREYKAFSQEKNHRVDRSFLLLSHNYCLHQQEA